MGLNAILEEALTAIEADRRAAGAICDRADASYDSLAKKVAEELRRLGYPAAAFEDSTALTEVLQSAAEKAEALQQALRKAERLTENIRRNHTNRQLGL